jgi:ubiquinone/menaquinone biosynthesis C-methylase UbiE
MTDDFMSAPKAQNYRSERGARAYHDDHQNKLHRKFSDRRERRILQDFFHRCGPVEQLLDVPCGFGRLLDLFGAHAGEVVEADFSPSMLALNRELHGDDAAQYLECSALEIPRPDGCFDAAVSIRLSHHLDAHDDRLRHVRELCRVSRRFVVLTFFSGTSLKNRLRRLRGRWNHKRPKNTLLPQEVREEFARQGFRVAAMKPLARIGSGHVYTLARRVTTAG